MSLTKQALRAKAPRATLVVLAALVAFGAWKLSALSSGNAVKEPEKRLVVERDPEGPPTQDEVPTTDGGISLDNLNGQIKGYEGAVAQAPRNVELKLTLVTLLGTRAKFVATITDLERADALAEETVRDEPKNRMAWIQRAATRASLHRFADALADLAEAERLGAKPPSTRAVRASILQAQGDADGALALRRGAREERADITTLSGEAAVLAELGRTEEAAALFKQALASYKDVSVFPVAWILFQEGTLWERAGKRDRARAFFAAARDRFPAYAHAVSHLATLEAPARAIELLRPAAAASDDPEIEMVLAQQLRRSGNAGEADQRMAHVRARYDELMAKHPEAFAEHAAAYWLDEGKDPGKALALAKQNLAVRKTDKAYELALLAATAAGAKDDACSLGAEVTKLPRASEMLKGIAARACQKP